METLLHNIQGLTQVVEAISVLAATIAATIAALGIKTKTASEHTQQVADIAVRAVEQARKVAQKKGTPFHDGDELKDLAIEYALRLAPNINLDELTVRIEAAVNNLTPIIIAGTVVPDDVPAVKKPRTPRTRKNSV